MTSGHKLFMSRPPRALTPPLNRPIAIYIIFQSVSDTDGYPCRYLASPRLVTTRAIAL